MQIYNNEILKVLAEAGNEGLSVKKIARHVHNAHNTLFSNVSFDEVYAYVGQYLKRNSKCVDSIIGRSDFPGVIGFNLPIKNYKQIMLQLKNKPAKDKSRISLKKITPISYFAAIILSVGYILPPKPLSPSSLAQKESPVIIDPESRCETPQPKENSSTISINRWKTAINSCKEAAYFNGKNITITGFVSNDLLKNYGYNYFNIARYVISCCTVDSVPMKILVEKNFSTDYPDGTWLIVKGKLSQKIVNSQAEYVITDAHITKINQPKYPYELLGL